MGTDESTLLNCKLVSKSDDICVILYFSFLSDPKDEFSYALMRPWIGMLLRLFI